MQNKMRGRGRQALGLVLLVMSVLPGCGSNELESPTAARLRGLGTLYLDYAVGKNGKGPAGEQEFKKHLRSVPGFVLEMNGVDPNALDAVFVSERDGEPFVILYGVSISGISGTSAPLIAHEKTGKNGKRLVVFANAKVEHVDEARLQHLASARR
jgi:hypothetical protein